MRSFRAKLYRVALVRWVDLPQAAVDSLGLPPAGIKGAIKGWNALLRFNGDLDRVTLLRGKRGRYKLAFKVELLRAAGVDAGDTIDFTLEPDTTSREPDLPDLWWAGTSLCPLWVTVAPRTIPAGRGTCRPTLLFCPQRNRVILTRKFHRLTDDYFGHPSPEWDFRQRGLDSPL